MVLIQIPWIWSLKNPSIDNSLPTSTAGSRRLVWPRQAQLGPLSGYTTSYESICMYWIWYFACRNISWQIGVWSPGRPIRMLGHLEISYGGNENIWGFKAFTFAFPKVWQSRIYDISLSSIGWTWSRNLICLSYPASGSIIGRDTFQYKSDMIWIKILHSKCDKTG